MEYAPFPTLFIEEAAQILGVSRNTAFKGARLRHFPALKIGRRWLVPRQAFLQWLLRRQIDDLTELIADFASPNRRHIEQFECETISIEQAAHVMGLHWNTAYDAAKRGDFPTCRVVGRWLVPRRAFLEWFHNKNRDPWADDR